MRNSVKSEDYSKKSGGYPRFFGVVPMNNKCYILSAMKLGDVRLSVNPHDFIIAADAGVRHLSELSLDADLIVGDFDSLGYIPNAMDIVIHPAEKDDTDTMLAVKEGLSRGFHKFVLLGALGGRLDHTLANLQSLGYLSSHGAIGYIIGDEKLITLVCDEQIDFDCSFSGTISLFSVGNSAEVTLIGLKYPLDHYNMTCNFPIGVSNEFVGCPSVVRVENGAVWMIVDYADGMIDKIDSIRNKLK